MATEGKTEVKTETMSAKASKQVAVVEENQEPALDCMTWVLKVSLNCEGCKRKVKKILANIEGVYSVEIDLSQQRVTVSGNVDAETLIKRLVKAGKRAELWPEKADRSKEKRKGKSKNKDKDQKENDKQGDVGRSEKGGDDGDQKEKETLKAEAVVTQEPTKNNTTSNNKPGAEVKEVKPEVKQPVTPPSGSQTPVADNKSCSESEGNAEKNESGGEKRKMEGHKGNNKNNGDEDHHSCDAQASTGSPGQGQGQSEGSVTYPSNHSPPLHHVYQYVPHSYAPPPVYAVSYSTMQPSTSYSASVNQPSYSYVYTHPGTATNEPQPCDPDWYPSQPSDSFEILSDENPNACSIM